MKVIIDRFEGDFAVVELPDKTTVNMPRVLVPGAGEGDVITIEREKACTDERRKKISALMDEVWND
ncbi:MAG: hypothetical protein BWY15_00928 [Firmicutes bacterium ADurb.Bin193]|nr:MAG: hypothetical protein BWY15_00928 [Firmicutes bacterium ADurb.Bin193]